MAIPSPSFMMERAKRFVFKVWIALRATKISVRGQNSLRPIRFSVRWQLKNVTQHSYYFSFSASIKHVFIIISDAFSEELTSA